MAQFPLVEFISFLRGLGLSEHSAVTYSNSVRRVLNKHGLNVVGKDLVAHRVSLSPVMQLRLDCAWKYFVEFAKTTGRVVTPMLGSTVGVEYPELRKLLPEVMTKARLTPRQLHRMRCRDLQLEEHPDGIFWIFSAWHGKKDGLIRHVAKQEDIEKPARKLLYWGHPYWVAAGPEGVLDPTRPLVPIVPGSTTPMSQRMIEMILKKAEGHP